MKSYLIKVFGIIQGVGFRPFVYNLAHIMNLKGSVCNTSACVEICLYEITRQELITFLAHLRRIPKPAKITSITHTIYTPQTPYKDFCILHQSHALPHTHTNTPLALEIPLDMAMCEQCYADMQSSGRFSNYAFCACTQCGARYSMLYTLPYERQNSAMSVFRFCESCAKDYHNPHNRRFHAQPISCNLCGIQLNFENTTYNEAALDSTIQALNRGEIVAIKGIGGYALVAKRGSTASTQRGEASATRVHADAGFVSFGCKGVRIAPQIALKAEGHRPHGHARRLRGKVRC